jgi:hypothetical protein
MLYNPRVSRKYPRSFMTFRVQHSFGRGVDGIIGIGPVALTRGTLSPNSNAVIPTVTDNAVAQGLISTEVIGIGFAPANSNDSTSMSIIFRFVSSVNTDSLHRWSNHIWRH